jgi:CheY-like chemotaxis protein
MALVLIVEDSDSVAPLEIALAASTQLQTMTLSNGRDALALLDAPFPQLAAVITDLHLPLVDGFELVAAIRAHRRYSMLPVIVVSGDSHPESRRRISELGANAFFAKPYSPGGIRKALEDLLHGP